MAHMKNKDLGFWMSKSGNNGLAITLSNGCAHSNPIAVKTVCNDISHLLESFYNLGEVHMKLYDGRPVHLMTFHDDDFHPDTVEARVSGDYNKAASGVHRLVSHVILDSQDPVQQRGHIGRVYLKTRRQGRRNPDVDYAASDAFARYDGRTFEALMLYFDTQSPAPINGEDNKERQSRERDAFIGHLRNTGLFYER